MTDTKRVLDSYLRNGWAPAPYAHHPDAIKAALRIIGMRPQIKQCFANCQRFIASVDWLDLQYHEGYITAIIPMEHAWLTWEGRMLDLTLQSTAERPIAYHGSNTYTRSRIRKSAVASGYWQVMDPRALHACHPMAKELGLLALLDE